MISSISLTIDVGEAMAVWQYDLIAVPRRALCAVLGMTPSCISMEVLDSHNWWNSDDVPTNDEFTSLLPASSSWTEAIKAWGPSDGTRLELHYDNGRLYELKIRVDLRESPREFVKAFTRLASQRDLILINDIGVVLEPDANTVLRDMTRSNSFAFVRSPNEFFDQLD